MIQIAYATSSGSTAATAAANPSHVRFPNNPTNDMLSYLLQTFS